METVRSRLRIIKSSEIMREHDIDTSITFDLNIPGIVSLHLPSAPDEEKKIAHLMGFREGLKKVALLIQENKYPFCDLKEKVEYVTATSWIVHKAPSVLRKLGFTVIDDADKTSFPFLSAVRKDARQRIKMGITPVPKDTPFSVAIMRANDFVERFGKKKDGGAR